MKIVVRVAPTGSPHDEALKPAAEVVPEPTSTPVTVPEPAAIGPTVEAKVERPEGEQIPARMLNEFVYCQRLFYYEFVEGVFVESADTLRGEAIHQRVDTGTGALPKAKRKADAEKAKAEEKAADTESASKEPQDAEPEMIHSRSVQMGSERLGVVAKMDLVEAKAEKEDLFTALEVCPVDYKAGAPKEGAEASELWDTDKMQLGLQALILRDNGYTCNEGIIYYRTTKQRVRLLITPELESWILQNIAEARRVITGPIPPPLVNSPKCVRC
ncbi:MAG: Dna2/Cas4 domain-containing protein, partial [Acidobacteriales bacterium]|nr:Dna2/Cas4 domain-containing protein [Terriglobales bacterium]